MIKLVATAMAKKTKRSSDDWDAPPAAKAALAFGIIWFLASLVQLFLILKTLKAIPSMAARGPYIILSVITLSFALSQVLYAVLIRTEGSASIFSASQFFWLVDTVFRPAVVLYLVHQRGDVLRAIKGNTPFPLSTRIWKRIMDWVLVAIALIMYIGLMGATAEEFTTPYNDYGQINDLYQISLGMGETGLAFLILLCIDVVVSLTFQIIQGRGTSDPIINRLKTTIIPLFGVYLFEVVFFNVFSLAADDYDAWAFTASNVFLDGAVRIAITTVLIRTMTLPEVLWTPPQVVAPEGMTGVPKESSTSSPINVGFTPQQQPASYWPQPHVLPHEMPLGMSHEGNPYAVPAGPEATRAVSQIYSTTSPATPQARTYQQPVTEISSSLASTTTQARTYQQPVAEIRPATSRTPTQAMPYQPLYPSSTRALPYQSPPPESTQLPDYRSPSPSSSSTQPLPYQIPSPVKAAPKQYQSSPSPTGELFTRAVFPEEKKERE